jgi:hypothetical protein
VDTETIINRVNKLSGRAGTAGKALARYKDCGYAQRTLRQDELLAVLRADAPKSMGEVYDKSLRRLFEEIHGGEIADWMGKVTERLHLYVHSPSTYRRSFRTRNAEPYFDRLLQILDTAFFFSWERFDLIKFLTMPPKIQNGGKDGEEPVLAGWILGDFLAVRIDEGDRAVIDAVKDIILGDNNTMLLSDGIINGIVKSENAELHKLLGDLLLAAKLQEGLRQSILENADNGRVEAFIYLMKIVLDNGLIRYSSALRAIDVWMGLGESFEDKRTVEKLLRLGYDYLSGAGLKEALESRDAIEIYTALWAVSVREMQDVVPLIGIFMKGEKYQKLTALYFLGQLENASLQFMVVSRLLDETDLDILSLVMLNYPAGRYYGWHNSREDFSKACRSYPFFADKEIRENQFASMLKILSLLPQKGYQSLGKPFPWCQFSLSAENIFTRLLCIAGFDFDPSKTDRLIEVMGLSDSDSRGLFIQFFLEKPENAKERAFLFAALNDKSMPVRTRALKNILSLKPDEEETRRILDLMALKTGDLRQNGVKLLLSLPGERSLEAAKTLLADKNENKRLAGLDMLTQLVNGERLEKSAAVELFSLMPRISAKEQVIMNALSAEKARYTKANGFGLYDAAYVPVFPELKRDPKHTLDSIFAISPERAFFLLDSLCGVIREHRDYSYKVENYDGVHDVLLGGLEWPRVREGVQKDGNLSAFDQFVLQEVWRDWIKQNGLSFSEVLYFMFIEKVKRYNDSYKPDYVKWANGLIEKQFHARAADTFIHTFYKKEYSTLALRLLSILWTEFPEAERFAVLSGAVIDLIKNVAEEDWKKPIEDETNRYRNQENTLADTEEVDFIMDTFRRAAEEDEHFAVYTAVCFEMGRLSGLFYRNLTAVDIARGIEQGLLKKDALYRTMFLAGEDSIRGYAGKIRWDAYRRNVEQYPLLKTAADESAARIIEIELDRGDSPTEVTSLALAVQWHEGAETFVKILTALGDETFVRGYIYSGNLTKKTVLSNLLKNSHPGPGENAGTLRACLAGSSLSDRRLIEAAMYAPAWLDIVGDYLGWPGLKSAAWYFHAHINENFSAEKETEVARYSSISPEKFNDGAFDIEWFREAYAALGAERFDLVYDCAKYLTEGSNHRRAQLFADAVLGRLDKKSLAAETGEKRNKDKLLSYSLIPLEENKIEDALERYEFIQGFLKESKSFGAQRRESEAKACAIASENLARNAGFSDALRFSWRMETLKVENIKTFFEPKPCGDYLVYIAIGDDGMAALVYEKDGRILASAPAALKKDPYAAECKTVTASLKDQFRRARANLEQEMVNRDVFEFGEIKTLMNHPVIAPLLQKLIFVSIDAGGKALMPGAFCELEGLSDTSPVRIAHPYDLYVLGTWISCQRYAFEHKLIQPFKQIFRELYLLNEDEKQEKTVSRRYAGHQVQPKKTTALLKSRGWTVDYEVGLQRVYYRENLIATVYAAADWFSPADTEAPTLETVQFFHRRAPLSSSGDIRPLNLEEIPPVIFSEVMRDLDLAVSVAHVGGVDPEASHSTIEMRAAIVRELLGLLHIENAAVEDRHAKIKGTLGEYTVHLGSAQVHKMGRGAVNILAVPSQHRGRIFLPFADDDPRTAEIMSKIVLLAEDHTIKDPAILNQIQ